MILSTTRKIHAIADYLRTGESPDLDPVDLGEPWVTYRKWIKDWITEDPNDVDLVRLRLDFMNYCYQQENDTNRHRRNHQLIDDAIKNPVTYQPIRAYINELPDMEWLWKDWLALGVISIFAAQTGAGKSYVALDLARRVINGDKFPDGSPVLKSGPVLYVDSENAPSLYKARVGTWSQDEQDGLYYMRADPDRFSLDLDSVDDRDRFLDHVCVLHPAMIIIDSYGSASSGGTNKKQDVQGLIGFLNRVAIDYQLAVLLVHHIRKNMVESNQNGNRVLTLDSIFGSMYITAWTRNVLMMQLAQWWNKNGPRRLWCEKSNAGLIREPMGINFRNHPLNSDVAMIEYGPAPEVDEEKTKTAECRSWLLDLLREAGEPVKPKVVLELGDIEGYNQRMVHRVRKQLDSRIRDTQGRFNPDNCWELVEETKSEGQIEEEAAEADSSTNSH
jgi:hypothetical protein